MTQRPPDEDFFRQFSELWPSSLFTTYVACICPYVGANTTALEISPGRGAWSKCILERGAKHLYAVDAAPAEHTKFWQYVGRTNQATGHVAELVGIEGGVVSGVINLESSGV
jgi:hypothetical protein